MTQLPDYQLTKSPDVSISLSVFVSSSFIPTRNKKMMIIWSPNQGDHHATLHPATVYLQPTACHSLIR